MNPSTWREKVGARNMMARLRAPNNLPERRLTFLPQISATEPVGTSIRKLVTWKIASKRPSCTKEKPFDARYIIHSPCVKERFINAVNP
jgi:hypothetical protein